MKSVVYPSHSAPRDFGEKSWSNIPDDASESVLASMGQTFSAPLEIINIAAGAASSDFPVGAAGLPGLAGERHFSPKELAERWRLSECKVRRMFETEPGVLRIGEPSRRVGRKLKRSYYTMRIPETAALRVHRRLTAGTIRPRFAC